MWKLDKRQTVKPKYRIQFGTTTILRTPVVFTNQPQSLGPVHTSEFSFETVYILIRFTPSVHIKTLSVRRNVKPHQCESAFESGSKWKHRRIAGLRENGMNMVLVSTLRDHGATLRWEGGTIGDSILGEHKPLFLTSSLFNFKNIEGGGGVGKCPRGPCYSTVLDTKKTLSVFGVTVNEAKWKLI